ncbi:MAG: DUF4868 domain-containing protein [Gudongella sp.]|jgi:hypothetical protein|nr:DUF4868 domain-containing protein [Gudongella sp.]
MDLVKAFNSIKKISWDKATVSFFVVKRKLVNREGYYEVLHVNVDDKMKKKLRNSTAKKITRANQAIEYDYNTADLDNNFLCLETASTDMFNILKDVASPKLPTTVTSLEQLLGTWMYIVRLDIDGKSLFSVRRVSDTWSTKKVFQSINAIFTNNILVDLNEKEIFRIDEKIDFFSFEDLTFIANKKNFEAALNFRKGMENNRDVIIEEFKAMSIFEDASNLGKLVGDNIKRLRKLSQVKNSGYYKDSKFLKCLKEVNEEDGWGIKYNTHGEIIVCEEDVETVLRILNNDRLTSKINQENFDVDVKHKIQ